MSGYPSQGMSRVILPLVLVGLWIMVGRPAHAAGDAACQAHVQQKRYEQAAGCYLQAFAQSKATAKQGPARVVAGRRLRNAAIAFQLAAKAQPSMEKKAYLYERGVQALALYLKGKWFENRYRQDSALLLRQKWRSKIGYAVLTVVVSPSSLRYTLKGYKNSRSLQGTWSKAVRPGSYVVSYTTPGRQVPEKKQFLVRPGKARVVVIKAVAPARRRPVVARVEPRKAPPRRRPTLPPPRRGSGLAAASWTVLGVGVAAAMLGGGLWIGARVLESQKNQGFERLRGDLSQAKASDTLSLVSMDQQARSLQPAGIAVLISGGALTALGAVFVALASRQPAPVQAATPPKGSSGKGITRARLLEGQTF